MNFINNIKKGIIHIGGNVAQEAEHYGNLNVLWIEPIPSVFNQLQKNIQKYPTQKGLNYLISDIDGKHYNFNVSSQSARSSFLEFTDHHFKDPNYSHTETLKIKSIRMDTLIRKHKINLDDYDALVTDCQGADYFVLKSFAEYLKHFSYIKSEVMTREIYKDLKGENIINEHLNLHDFELISNFPYRFKKTQRDNIWKNRH